MYNVDAVHDILKRVLKFKLSEKEKDDLVQELLEHGYEEKNIIVERIDCQS